MPSIYQVADAQRQALMRRERPVVDRLVAVYGEAWRRLEGQAQAVGELIDEARKRGEEPDTAWLLRQERTRSLLGQVEAEVRALVPVAGAAVTDAQAAAVLAARDDAGALIAAGMGTPPPGVALDLARLPVEAVTELIGYSADGSPLRAVLERLAPGAAEGVARALAVGVSMGANPNQTARLIRKAWGANLAHAKLVARTETLRAYREVAYRTYEANSDVVAGWIWHASLRTRSCAACIARHGSVHPLSEKFADHPAGRCAALPWTKTWRELGFDVDEPERDLASGADWFAQQDQATQMAVLGPAKFAAYRDGALALEDLAGLRRSRAWGATNREVGLTEALGAKKATSYIAKAREAA